MTKKCGSLYLNGVATRPGLVYCNEQLVIGDTEPSKEIGWVEVNGLLVADRCICTNISWDQLDELGFVYGKPIRIDGENHLCRMLKVGTSPKRKNEWNEIIKVTSDSDALWHWSSIFFWGQESDSDSACRMVRGGVSPRHRQTAHASIQLPAIGFRPVLEPLSPEPKMSETLLGSKLTVFLQNCRVSGVLEEYSAYDLVLRLTKKDSRGPIPGTGWTKKGQLVIDRGTILYTETVKP